MRLRPLVVAVVLIAIMAIAVFYVFYLVPSGGSSTTSSTVITPANLLAITGQPPQASCGQPSGTYSNTSLVINWGNLAPDTEGLQYVCLRNTGTTAVTLAVTSNLPSSVGRITSPQAGSVLNGGGTELIEVDLYLTPNASTGPMPGFTITIGGGS